MAQVLHESSFDKTKAILRYVDEHPVVSRQTLWALVYLIASVRIGLTLVFTVSFVLFSVLFQQWCHAR